MKEQEAEGGPTENWTIAGGRLARYPHVSISRLNGSVGARDAFCGAAWKGEYRPGAFMSDGDLIGATKFGS